jgi:trehalose-6-phosphate synthase
MNNTETVLLPIRMGLIQSKETIDLFMKKMKTYTGTLKLIVLCHGNLIGPIQLKKHQIHRISSVPLGVCTFNTIDDKLSLLKLFTEDIDYNSSYLPIIKEQFKSIVHKQCNDIDPKLESEDYETYKKWSMNALDYLDHLKNLHPKIVIL